MKTNWAGGRHRFKGWHWYQEILWIYENNLANWLCGKFKNSSKLVNHNYQVLQVAGRWTMLKKCSKMAELNKTGTKQKLSASQTQCQLLHVVWLFLNWPIDDQTGVIIIIIILSPPRSPSLHNGLFQIFYSKLQPFSVIKSYSNNLHFQLQCKRRKDY